MDSDATATERRMIMVFPFECPVCGHKTNMPQTNADRIRAMTDDELHELLHEIYNAGAENAVAYVCGQRAFNCEWTMKWLRQPAEEG